MSRTIVENDRRKLFSIEKNKLQELMESEKIEYVQNGNRRLLCEAAILDWYNPIKSPLRRCGGVAYGSYGCKDKAGQKQV